MKKVRVAIAGVGNCASSLMQGVSFYRDAPPDEIVPGLMHVVLGGYHVGDLEAVAAFDVDAAKVGTDLGKAIFAGQNNTIRFAEVGELGVTVQRGPTLDGLGRYYRETIEESPAAPVDVAEALRDARAHVLVAYLPVGSEEAQRYYAEAALDAGVAFVNAIPVFIASDPPGPGASPRPASPSSATTSRARWARPSSTGCSPGSSRTGASPSTTPTSSTWAATWTSATCWSASASSRRRSRRPRP